MGSEPEVLSHRDSTPAQNARKTWAVGAQAGNLWKWWSEWWAHKDSNLGPAD
jgi:hypothetical protein